MKNYFAILLLIQIISTNSFNGQDINSFLTKSELLNADLGYVAYNIDEDQTIASINPDKKLTPASILKVLSTNVALDILGEDYTFKTGLGYTGELIDGEVNDLIIFGGGDPTIGFNIQTGKSESSQDFFEFIKENLNANGINKIKGKIMLDVSHFTAQPLPDGWIWSDIGNYYGAGSYGFNYFGNRYSIFFNSGKSAGSSTDIVDIFPRIDLDINNEVTSQNINSDQAYLYGGPYQEQILAEGAIPLNKRRFEVKGALPNPPKTFLEIFIKQLKSWAIKFDGETDIFNNDKIKYTAIGTYHSPSLADIVTYTNRRSDNFFAETILRELGFNHGEGSTRKGVQIIKEYFSENELGNLAITDGSGLSRNNRLSPSEMVEFLKYNIELKEQNFSSFGLSIAGKTGSMKRVGPGTCFEGKMMGKSGYVNGVRSYTGLYLNEKDERIVFCIILNNYNCSASRARALITELLELSLCQ